MRVNLVMHIRKYIIIMLWPVFLSVFVIGQSYAGTWRDEFDAENLNG